MERGGDGDGVVLRHEWCRFEEGAGNGGCVFGERRF